MPDGPPSPKRLRTTTAAMEAYADGSDGPARRPELSGLVLLYAPAFERLPPAFVLRGEQVLVGREAPAEILIPLASVSRRHARMVRQGARWVLADLGARNGTLVNGRRVGEHTLAHNDAIRIGDAFFKFVSDDAPGYLRYRIDGAVLNAPATPPGMVGGYSLATLATALQRIAQSPIAVMIRGESGAGKEIFARQVHAWSERKGAFCALNCAAIPATLLESELFGYRRGAFSGADRDHVGLVRAADRGTLFLDEVGDLPLEAQAKLLRVLQTKEVLPLGATGPEQVDLRIVCATNRDLAAMQRAERFRGDLYARLNEYSVTIPPLRDRKEDIYALCRAFLERTKRPDLELSIPYLTGLLHYDFPYNVRELEALIKRGVALAEGDVLGAEHLSDEVRACMKGYGALATGASPAGGEAAGGWPSQPGSAQPHPVTDEPTASSTWSGVAPRFQGTSPASRSPTLPTELELRASLARHQGNVAAVGRDFGKERVQVHRWMKRYAIDPNEYR